MEFKEFLNEAKTRKPFPGGKGGDADQIAAPFDQCISEFEEQLKLMKEELRDMKKDPDDFYNYDNPKQLEGIVKKGEEHLKNLKKAFVPVDKWLRKMEQP